MKGIADILNNHVLFVVLLGWFVAQALKIPIYRIVEHKWDFSRFHGSGGMPSSHSAAVCALAMASAIAYGLNSFQFAVSVVLALIVMRDASGVRRSAGEQAKIINRMIKTLSRGGTIDFNSDIKEIIGHTPFQVFVGAALGVAVPFLMMLIMPVR